MAHIMPESITRSTQIYTSDTSEAGVNKLQKMKKKKLIEKEKKKEVICLSNSIHG